MEANGAIPGKVAHWESFYVKQALVSAVQDIGMLLDPKEYSTGQETWDEEGETRWIHAASGTCISTEEEKSSSSSITGEGWVASEAAYKSREGARAISSERKPEAQEGARTSREEGSGGARLILKEEFH